MHTYDKYKLFGYFNNFDGTFADPCFSESKNLLGVYSTSEKAKAAEIRAKNAFKGQSEYGSNCLSGCEIVEPETIQKVTLDKDIFPNRITDKNAYTWRIDDSDVY